MFDSEDRNQGGSGGAGMQVVSDICSSSLEVSRQIAATECKEKSSEGIEVEGSQQLEGCVECDRENSVPQSSSKPRYKYNREDYEGRDIDINFDRIEEEKEACVSRIEANNCDVEALVKLGYIEIRYYKNKKTAMQIFLKVLALDENDIDGLLGKCYCVLEDKKKHEFDLCQEHLDQCFAQHIKYWRIYYYQSMLFYLRYKDYLGKRTLLKALKLKQNHYLSLSLFALISAELKSDLNKAKEMIDDLMQRPEGFNNDFSVYYRAGKIYEKLRLSDQSISFFQQSAKYRQNYSQAIKMVSFVYMTQKEDLDKAAEFGRQSIEMDTTNDEAFMNLGEVLERQSKTIEAVEQFQKAIEINPHNETAYMLVLDIYEQMGGKKKEFHDLCEKFIKYNPNSADANFEMGYSFSTRKNLFESVRYYRKSLEQQVLIDSYNNLGNVFFQLKDLEEAEIYFTKAHDYDPVDESFNDNLNTVVQHSLFIEQDGGDGFEEEVEIPGDWEEYNNDDAAHPDAMSEVD